MMVDTWGLLDFFLTFTIDEVTDTRWQEINVIESIATHYNVQFTWKDCAVKCVVLFHTRFHMFMRKHLLPSDGLLGRIEHHVIRYEIQNRGSLHAHVILWVHHDDHQRMANEIAAYIPRDKPLDPRNTMLRKLVLRKQLHICKKACYVGPSNHSCKHGFPFTTQPEYEPILDPLM